MDTHTCNKCHSLILGLDNYVIHRKSGQCDTRTQLVPPENHTGGKWKPTRVVERSNAGEHICYASNSDNVLDNLLGSVYLRCCGVTLNSDIDVIRHKLSLTHKTSRIAATDDNCDHDLEVIERRSARLFPFICKSCNFYTTQMSAFVWHLNSSEHLDNVLHLNVTCLRCTQKFNNMSDILKHLWKEKMSPSLDISGDSRLFVSENHLNPENGVSFGCKLCKYESRTRFGLKRHTIRTHQFRSHQKLDDQKPYTCNKCLAKFKTKSTLRLHVKRHMAIEDRPFKCQLCDYAFVERKELVMHSKTHSTDTPFKCPSCDHRTRSIFSLRKHQKIHASEKPFKCKLCPFASRLSSNLIRHSRVHSGAKPYSCPHDDCDYKSASQENLRKHILKGRKHLGKTVYCCPSCDFNTNEFKEWSKHKNSTCT